MDRVLPRGGELSVGHDVGPHISRLQRDLDVAGTVIEVLEDLAVSQRHLDHPVCCPLPVVAVDAVLLAQALVHLFGQRPGVDADAKWDLAFLGRVHHLDHLLAVGEVAGVEAQAMHARLDRQERQRVVVMDVRDHRQWRSLDDLLERLRRLSVGHGRPAS